MRPDEEIADLWALQAGLKQLVTRLGEGELWLVRSWVEAELRLIRDRTVLRLVRTPEPTDRRVQPDPALFEGAFVELAGMVRRQIHDLPEDRLLVLMLWVDDRLRNRFGL